MMEFEDILTMHSLCKCHTLQTIVKLKNLYQSCIICIEAFTEDIHPPITLNAEELSTETSNILVYYLSVGDQIDSQKKEPM